jgi:RNA polymerase sigma-70 factor (ECF subfamily)
MERQLKPIVPALRRYSRGLLGDRGEADDLVQDCLERAISCWHQRRDDGSTRAWVFSILHNLTMTHLQRARRNAPHLALSDAGNMDELSIRPSQEDCLRYSDLLAALAQLPENQRAVLLLVAVEKLSYADTAMALSLPIGTVMSRLSRARERLLTLMSTESRSSTDRPHLRSVK